MKHSHISKKIKAAIHSQSINGWSVKPSTSQHQFIDPYSKNEINESISLDDDFHPPSCYCLEKCRRDKN